MTKYMLITGASRGIGKSTALLFAQNGYYVFLNCRTSMDELQQTADEIISLGGQCEVLIGDVGNSHDVCNIFSQIYQRCECLDLLINNAGMAHMGLLQDMTDNEWNQLLQTNLSSVFYCSREAIAPMVQRQSGHIINSSSIWGSIGASCEVAYSASKAGIHGLTKALAKELAPSNVRVNAIAFGVIDTQMNQQLDAKERVALAVEIPAGRFATPEEAAQMIWNVHLTPGYMTGQIIGFDGGF